MGYYNASTVLGFAKGAASRYGVDVKFNLAPGQSPCTDGTTIHLPQPIGIMTDLEYRDAQASVVHELTHHLLDSVPVFKQFAAKGKAEALAMNTILDVADETHVGIWDFNKNGIGWTRDLLRDGNNIATARNLSIGQYEKGELAWAVSVLALSWAAGISSSVKRRGRYKYINRDQRAAADVWMKAKDIVQSRLKDAGHSKYAWSPARDICVRAVAAKSIKSTRRTRKRWDSLIQLASKLADILRPLIPAGDTGTGPGKTEVKPEGGKPMFAATGTPGPGDKVKGDEAQGEAMASDAADQGPTEAAKDASKNAAVGKDPDRPDKPSVPTEDDARRYGAGTGAGSGAGVPSEPVAQSKKLLQPAIDEFVRTKDAIQVRGRYASGRCLSSPTQAMISGRGFGRNDTDEGEELTVAVVLDCSSSMRKIMDRTKNLAEAFAQCIEGVGQTAIRVQFGMNPNDMGAGIYQGASNNTAGTVVNLSRCAPVGGTPTSIGVEVAREELKKHRGRKAMVILTDGEPDSPDRLAHQLRMAHGEKIKLFGIGLEQNPGCPRASRRGTLIQKLTKTMPFCVVVGARIESVLAARLYQAFRTAMK